MADLINLAGRGFKFARLIEREDFKKRLASESTHRLSRAIISAVPSVMISIALNADVELGVPIKHSIYSWGGFCKSSSISASNYHRADS